MNKKYCLLSIAIFLIGITTLGLGIDLLLASVIFLGIGLLCVGTIMAVIQLTKLML